jgi:hypothetical protein
MNRKEIINKIRFIALSAFLTGVLCALLTMPWLMDEKEIIAFWAQVLG